MGRLYTNSSKGTKTEQELAHDLSNFVEIGQVSVHYEISGDVSNLKQPLIVLLHGFGANTFSWRKQMKPLSKFGLVVSYDRPAFGLTVRPKHWKEHNPYGFRAQIELLNGIIKYFGPARKVILIGHSAGAAIAAEWALNNQKRVLGLVFEGPAILTLPPSPKPMAKLMRTSAFDRIGPRLVGGFKKAGTEILYRSWFDKSKITPEVKEGYFLPLQVKGWEAGFWEFVRVGNPVTVQSRLPELKVPALVITGDPDEIIPTKDSVKISELLPNSKLVVFPNCGHIPHEEKADYFETAVETFIRQL